MILPKVSDLTISYLRPNHMYILLQYSSPLWVCIHFELCYAGISCCITALSEYVFHKGHFVFEMYLYGISLLQYGSLDLSANSSQQKPVCPQISFVQCSDQSQVLYLLLLQCIPQVQYSAVGRPISSVVFAVQPHILQWSVQYNAVLMVVESFICSSFWMQCNLTSSAVSSVHIILDCFIGVVYRVLCGVLHLFLQYILSCNTVQIILDFFCSTSSSAIQCRSFLSVVFAVWPHISLIGSVLGDPFPSSSIYNTAQCDVMSCRLCSAFCIVRCSAMSLGLGGIFSWWGHTCAITSALQWTKVYYCQCTKVHYSALVVTHVRY